VDGAADVVMAFDYGVKVEYISPQSQAALRCAIFFFP
jgi:hypothetical protein